MKQYRETVKKDFPQDFEEGIKYQDQEIFNLVNRIKKDELHYLAGEKKFP